MGSIPGWGRSPGGENGNPRQYSCLENSKDRGARWATVHGVSESDRTDTQVSQQVSISCIFIIFSFPNIIYLSILG